MNRSQGIHGCYDRRTDVTVRAAATQIFRETALPIPLTFWSHAVYLAMQPAPWPQLQSSGEQSTKDELSTEQLASKRREVGDLITPSGI